MQCGEAEDCLEGELTLPVGDAHTCREPLCGEPDSEQHLDSGCDVDAMYVDQEAFAAWL